LLAPQRGLFAIGQNQNRENVDVQSIAKVFILVIPAKAGIQYFQGISGLPLSRE
jgi:hypothetical protein